MPAALAAQARPLSAPSGPGGWQPAAVDPHSRPAAPPLAEAHAHSLDRRRASFAPTGARSPARPGPWRASVHPCATVSLDQTRRAAGGRLDLPPRQPMPGGAGCPSVGVTFSDRVAPGPRQQGARPPREATGHLRSFLFLQSCRSGEGPADRKTPPLGRGLRDTSRCRTGTASGVSESGDG